MFNLGKPIGSVTDSSPSLVRISISSMEIFELYKSKLSVGQFILIASGNNLYLLTTITAIRVSQIDNSQDVTEGNMSAANSVTFRFQVDTQPIGTLSQMVGLRVDITPYLFQLNMHMSLLPLPLVESFQSKLNRHFL